MRLGVLWGVFDIELVSMFSPLFRTGCCCLRFSMHYPFRLYIGCHLVFFFIFLCSPPRLFRVFFILLFYFPYLTLFSRLFTSFSAPIVAAFVFRCIAPSYRLSGAFSSFSFYSPSFYSPLRLFRVFFILFFIFRILRSFPVFSSHFSRRSFLRFFLVPGRK